MSHAIEGKIAIRKVLNDADVVYLKAGGDNEPSKY